MAKFYDQVPLYRQSVIYEREGEELSRALLADWIGACSDLLAPVVDAIGRHVRSAGKLHADDIPLPVLAPGLGKTTTGPAARRTCGQCGLSTRRRHRRINTPHFCRLNFPNLNGKAGAKCIARQLSTCSNMPAC